MNRRIIIMSLLLAATCLPFLSLSLPNANSLSNAASTTMTITQPPAQGQCSMLSIPFSAHAGEQITGSFGSDVSVNFYILTQDDLNSIQNCRLPASARTIFIEEKSVGHDNPYRSLSFPATGTYYFVFLWVRGPTQLTKNYATLELSYPPSVSIMGTGNSSNSLVTTVSPSLTVSSLTLVPSSTLTALTSSSQTLSTPMSTSMTETTTSAASTEATPASGLVIFGYQMPMSSLLLIIGGVIVAAGGLIGGSLYRNRKRRTLSSYLERIDSTYNEYAVDREECRDRLERLKRDLIEMLNKGKIDEGHFLMLDEKITEYLKALPQATIKSTRPLETDARAETSASQQTATPETKYCGKCGARLSRKDKVCKRCGTTQA